MWAGTGDTGVSCLDHLSTNCALLKKLTLSLYVLFSLDGFSVCELRATSNTSFLERVVYWKSKFTDYDRVKTGPLVLLCGYFRCVVYLVTIFVHRYLGYKLNPIKVMNLKYTRQTEDNQVKIIKLDNII